MAWRPTRIERYLSSAETSTKVARVLTDAGEAYMKAMGNPEGPHALVREYVGTSLAAWFGLPTFEYAIIEHDAVVDIPFGRGKSLAEAGPAFLARAHEGSPWSGNQKELEKVENLEMITKLVAFDTWVRNRDRCSSCGFEQRLHYDNVFLSEEGASPGKFRLIAMDFSHCLQEGAELNRHVSDIGNVQDDRVYGLFKSFERYLQRDMLDYAFDRLLSVDKRVLDGIISRIPSAWGLEAASRTALREFLVRRAGYIVNILNNALSPFFEKQGNLLTD